MYSVQCQVYSAQCAVCGVQCAVYSVQCAMCSGDRLHGGDLLLGLGDREAASEGHVAGVRDHVLPGPGWYWGREPKSASAKLSTFPRQKCNLGSRLCAWDVL